MNNAKVRQEILDNAGEDIGVSGRGQQDYIDTYNSHRAGEISEDEAIDRIADSFGEKEMTGNTHEPYSDYYGERYRQQY